MPACPSTKAATRLKVLCVSGSLGGGGSERQLWQLVSHLDRTRFQCHVYLQYRQGIYLHRLPPDVIVHSFWSPERPEKRRFPGQVFRSLVADLARVIVAHQIDIVYDRTYHATLFSSLATAWTRTPRASVIVCPPSRDIAGNRERFRFCKRWLLKRAYQSSTALTLAVSDDVADDAARYYGIQRDKIQVIASPVDIASVQTLAKQPTKDLACLNTPLQLSDTPSFEDNSPYRIPDARMPMLGRREQALPKDRFQIAVVARLSAEKGQSALLRAVAALISHPEDAIDCHVHIIGEGADRAKIQQLIVDLQIQSRVTMHGFLNNPYPLIAQCDLLCIPSLYEGLPNVALESLAIGTPIVASRCSHSLVDLLGDEQRGLLFDINDHQQLAQQIAKSARDVRSARARARAGQTWVRQHHSIEDWLNKMSQLFLRLRAGTSSL